MKVKYIKNCKAILYLIIWDCLWYIKYVGLVGGWAIWPPKRGVIGYQRLGNFLLVPIFIGMKKCIDLVQSIRIKYKLGKKFLSNYFCVTDLG